MKKILFFLSAFSLFNFISCSSGGSESSSGSGSSKLVTIDYTTAKSSFSSDFTVTPNDNGTYEKDDTKKTITLKTGSSFTLSGYYNGQIINTVKGMKIILNNAYLENDGSPALYGQLKTELSPAKDTVNYIVSTGTSDQKYGAFHCEKAIELGGGGTCTIAGNIYHGVKGGDITFKGSGKYFIQGTSSGSAINCNNFKVETEKTFNLYAVNSKNAIKADETIAIASGNFYFSDNGTVFKTDTSTDDATVTHSISLTGGAFSVWNNTTLYSTEANGYSVASEDLIKTVKFSVN